MESPTWCPHSVALCEEVLRMGTMPLVSLWSFVWEEVVPWHLPWCQTQFLPVCHRCPSSCCPCAGAQRKWVCISSKPIGDPLRGDPWESPSFFCCPSTRWFLRTEGMETYLHGTGTLGWVVWCGADIPPLEVSLLIFIHHMWVWDHLFLISESPCISVPPTHLDECDFFNSLVVRLPSNSIFWWFWVIVVL